MVPILIVLSLAAMAVIFRQWARRKSRLALEQQSISAEGLHALLESRKEVLVYDVRLPLDFLAAAEVIPGAQRITPKEIEGDTSLIPRDRETIVYCTCPSDETSYGIVKKARKQNFLKVKFLKGGLAAWKAKGYPVEPYGQPFHLDTAT